MRARIWDSLEFICMELFLSFVTMKGELKFDDG